MKRKLTCIICPRGCPLEVTVEDGKVTVTGNTCPKGAAYGAEECVNPMRTVTSAVRVANRSDTMVSVKTAAPIPKREMLALMAQIRAVTVEAPVHAGDVLIPGVFGIDVVATSDVR